MRPDIGAEEDFQGLAQGRIAYGASPMLELEVPDVIAPRTTVMRVDLHLPIDHVLLRGRIAASLERGLTLRRAKPGRLEGQRVWSLRINDSDADVEIDGIPQADRLTQFCQGLANSSELAESRARLIMSDDRSTNGSAASKNDSGHLVLPRQGLA
jgi:hypothetical protein